MDHAHIRIFLMDLKANLLSADIDERYMNTHLSEQPDIYLFRVIKYECVQKNYVQTVFS